MKRVLKYLWPFKAQMTVGLFIKIVGTVAELLIPFIMTYILDIVIVTGNVKKIILFGILMLASAAIA